MKEILLSDFQKTLTMIKNRLSQNNFSEIDILNVTKQFFTIIGPIQQKSSVFQFDKEAETLAIENILKTMHIIIKQIGNLDTQVACIEKEMLGARNYSGYEDARIKNIVYKNELKNILQDMLTEIYTHRPDLHPSQKLSAPKV